MPGTAVRTALFPRSRPTVRAKGMRSSTDTMTVAAATFIARSDPRILTTYLLCSYRPLPAYLPSTDCAISSMSLGQPDPHTRHFRSYRSLQRSIQIEGTATERHRVRPERGGVLAARNHPRCRWTGRPSSNTRTVVVHIALAQDHREREGRRLAPPKPTGLWPTVRMGSGHSRLTRLCGRCTWTSANPAPRSPDPRSQADAVAVEPPFSNSRVSLG
jgi:hypothetical protein